MEQFRERVVSGDVNDFHGIVKKTYDEANCDNCVNASSEIILQANCLKFNNVFDEILDEYSNVYRKTLSL